MSSCAQDAERTDRKEQHKHEEKQAHPGSKAAKDMIVQTAQLWVPELDVLKQAFAEHLKDEYENLSVEVVDCPDLRKWGLPREGLCGDERLVDVGGEPNLFNPQYHYRSAFAISEVAAAIDCKKHVFTGSGAVSARLTGGNAELMPAECLDTGKRCTTSCRVAEDGKYKLEDYDHDEFGLLCNMFACLGKPGKVLKVTASCVTGRKDDNIISQLRRALIALCEATDKHHGSKERDPKRQIGMGGVFRVNKGKVRAHVMPDFKKTVMVPGKEITDWLRFYEMGPHLTCLTTFITGDPLVDQLNLRLEHTHFFNKETGQGGHYHFSVTPEEVEYECYLLPTAVVHRVENAFRRKD